MTQPTKLQREVSRLKPEEAINVLERRIIEWVKKIALGEATSLLPAVEAAEELISLETNHAPNGKPLKAKSDVVETEIEEVRPEDF